MRAILARQDRHGIVAPALILGELVDWRINCSTEGRGFEYLRRHVWLSLNVDMKRLTLWANRTLSGRNLSEPTEQR